MYVCVFLYLLQILSYIYIFLKSPKDSKDMILRLGIELALG